jgi:hypothetical protein
MVGLTSDCPSAGPKKPLTKNVVDIANTRRNFGVCLRLRLMLVSPNVATHYPGNLATLGLAKMFQANLEIP